MSENGVAPAPPDEDRTPTQEDLDTPVNQWVMPEPVFRRSSGYTPQGVAGTVETEESDDPTTSDQALNVEQDDSIAEQPDLTDNGTESTFESAPSESELKTNRGGSLRWLMFVLGIGIAVLAVAAAAVMIVLWYFFQVSESQNLN